MSVSTVTWPWYVVRASGIVSLSLLILLMLSGIGHVTGWTYRVLSPLKAWALHKAMALALAGSIAVHCIALLLDTYVHFSLADVLVPFAAHYNGSITPLFGWSVGGFAIAAGILAAYGIYLVVASSLDTVGWIQRHKKVWKIIHIASYASMFLVLIHALAIGSDFKHGVLRATLVIFGGVLVAGSLARLRRLPSRA